jgi:hypothetical protein
VANERLRIDASTYRMNNGLQVSGSNPIVRMGGRADLPLGDQIGNKNNLIARKGNSEMSQGPRTLRGW